MWRTLLMFAMLALGAVRGGAQTPFVSKEAGNVFFENQPVRFSAGEGSGKISIEVIDAQSRAVLKGEYPLQKIDLGKMSRGYYEIREAGKSASVPFAVVAVPRQKEEGWAAADVALSWLVPQERYAEGAEIVRRAGARWVRDRISWAETETARGKYVWGRYDRAAQAQESRGLLVAQVFHDVPAWARSDKDTHRFPDDLRDAYRFAKEAARHFGGRVKTWEVWNEADIPGFSIDPASEYAAFFKAASLGFKSANGGLPVAQTSLALDSPLFADRLAANGTSAFYDIYNFHTYDAPKNYAQRFMAQRRNQEKAEAPEKPLWLTEAGAPRPHANKAVTPAHLWEQATYVAKSYAESRIHGAARHFFFVVPHYVENQGSYGVLTEDLKPRPAYAALATAIDALGNANYVGEIRYRQPGLHLYAFEDNENTILVGWTDQDEVLLPLPLTERGKSRLSRAELRNCLGTPLVLRSADKERTPTLPLSPAPIFMLLPKGVLEDVISAPHTALKSKAPTEPKRKRYERAEIVLRLRPTEGVPNKKEEAFQVSAGKPVTFEAQIYCFGGGAGQGTVQLRAESPRIKLSRVSFDVDRMKEMDRKTETFTITLEPGAERASLTAVFVGTGGERSSPAVIDIVAAP